MFISGVSSFTDISGASSFKHRGNNVPEPAAGWVRALIRPRGMAEGSAAREGHVDELKEQKVSTAARACLQVFKPAVRLLPDSRCKAME